MGKLLSKQKPRIKQRGSKKNLEFYLKQKYTIVVRPLSNDEGGGWFAEIPLLSGCWSDGETPDDAIVQLSEAKALWMESMISNGKVIPLP